MSAFRCHLLVSVRSVVEAEAALAGGADLVDVKNPVRGSLGRADDSVLASIIESVADRRPVSAALGELLDFSELPAPFTDLAYLKWGLAGCRNYPRWRERADRLREQIEVGGGHCQVVFAAYADWELAQSPPVEEVCAFACQGGSVFLVDTFDKGPGPAGRPRTLLDWLNLDELMALCQRCRESRVSIALAGSLGLKEIERLLPLQPDWIAVRGAACPRGRSSVLSAERVRRLRELLVAPSGFLA